MRFSVPDLLPLVSEIYAAIDDDTLWPRIPQIIAQLLGAHAFAVSHQAIGDARSKPVLCAGFDKDALQDYFTNWDEPNPWRRMGLSHVLAKAPAERFEAVHLSTVAPPKHFRQSAAFNESLSKMDLYDAIALPLEAERRAMWMAFFCGKSRDLFDDGAINAARAVAPHVARAARLTRERAEAARHFDGAKLSEFGAPAAIVSRRGEIIDANAAFRAHAMQDANAAMGKRLALSDPLGKAVVKFLDSIGEKAGRRSAAEIALSDGSRLRLHALTGLVHMFDAGKPVDFCLMALDRSARTTEGAQHLKQSFSLTNTEAEIAALIVQGRSPAEIASMRSCSVATVLWHIRQIYSKTGVSSRADLKECVNSEADEKPAESALEKLEEQASFASAL